jgi:prophage regulatory protein
MMSMVPTTENEIKANEKRSGGSVRRFLRFHEVRRATGLAHATIYEWMDLGKFPKSVPLGGRRIGWIEDEIVEWQNQRIAEREKQAKATAA